MDDPRNDLACSDGGDAHDWLSAAAVAEMGGGNVRDWFAGADMVAVDSGSRENLGPRGEDHGGEVVEWAVCGWCGLGRMTCSRPRSDKASN